jgi:tetratricopeptide (TPR) repeat protein
MYPLLLAKYKSVSGMLVKPYSISVLTDCVVVGLIQVAHAVIVHINDDRRPIFAVASEVNMMAKTSGAGSHFMCTYDDRHSNYGSSDDWADLTLFAAEALRLITKRFPELMKLNLGLFEFGLLHDLMDRYQRELKSIDPQIDPEAYALTKFKWGNVCRDMAVRHRGKQNYFLAAIEHYHAAIPYLSRDKHPREYTDTFIDIAHSYSNAVINKYSKKGWINARDALQEAITTLNATIAAGHDYPDKDLELGQLYDRLGVAFKRLDDFPKAIEAWRLSLEPYQKAQKPDLEQKVVQKIAEMERKLLEESSISRLVLGENRTQTLPHPLSEHLAESIFDAAFKAAEQLKEAQTPLSIPVEQLGRFIDKTFWAKTAGPSTLTEWRQTLAVYQPEETNDKAAVQAFIAVLDDQPAVLPVDNPYHMSLARVMGKISDFRQTREALRDRRKEGPFPKYSLVDENTFLRLFLEASDLPANMRFTEDYRRENWQPLDDSLSERVGQHSGAAIWVAEIDNPLWFLKDIRWTFPNEDRAYAYHCMELATNSEGLPNAVGIEVVGSDGYVFGGTSKDPALGKELTQLLYLFRVNQTVVKLYVAEGYRSPDEPRVTPDLVKPIAEKIVSRILEVGG